VSGGGNCDSRQGEEKSAIVAAIRKLEKQKELWTNHDVVNQHVTRYRKDTLFPLKQAGLKIEDSEYWFQWTFPAKLPNV
jgi:hypothetical protein